MFELTTVIAFIAALVIIFPLSWSAGRNQPATSSYRVLDLALTSFVLFFIISRILGMLYFKEGLPSDWSFLPLSQPESSVEFFQTWPWVIFNFSDGRFLFLECISGFAIAELVFMILNGRRMKLTRQRKIREQAFAIFSISLIPLFVVAYLNDYLANVFDAPFLLLIAGLNLVAALLVSNLYSDQSKVKAVVLGVQIVSIAMFNMLYLGESTDIILINVVLGLLLAFNIAKYTLEIMVVSEDSKKIVRNITSEST